MPFMAKEIARKLKPTSDYDEVLQRQKETSHALTMIIKKEYSEALKS